MKHLETENNKYNLTKSELKTILQLNGKLVNINKLMEKCGFDFPATQKIMKKLMLLKIVDVELCYGKTNFKLTDEGMRIAKEVYIKRKVNGNYGAVIYHIDENEVMFPGRVLESVKTLLREYNEGEYLIDPHVEYVIKLLERTEHGMELINKGINKIEVETAESAYTLRVFTEDNTYTDIPVNRLLGERKKYNHKTDVNKALHHDTEIPLPLGKFRYHDNPSFSELRNSFFKEYNLSFDIIETTRIQDRLTIADEKIRSAWIDYYKNNSHYIIVTEDEMRKLHHQKTVLGKRIHELQTYFGCEQQ